METNIVEILHRVGVSEEDIAKELKVPVANVRAFITLRKTSTFQQPEDKELADAMRDLAWLAYKEARIIIEYGAPGEKLGLIKTILSRTASMVGSETITRYDEMRNEFDDMLVGFSQSVDFDEQTETSSLTLDPFDPDEGSDY